MAEPLMVTLSKRADKLQTRLLKIVSGSVRNTAHAHYEWGLTDTAARSIAKRVVGTLSSQWDDVLALRKKSVKQG